MTIQDVVKALDATLLVPIEGDTRTVGRVVASDLMSDVLLVDAEDMLLLTSLASDQVIRTAHIVGAVGVVIHNGKPLPSSMAAVAQQLRIPLLTTPLSKYDSCVRLYTAQEAESK